jgi:pumilio RNA-binding family
MGGMGGRRGGREGGARGGLGKGGAHGSRDSLHGLNGGSGSSSSIPRTASFNGLGGQDTAQEIADMDARFGSVDECLGQISVLARDQHGCRFLQRKFDDEGEDAVNKCYDEIIAEVVDLMMDPFGNYLVQKLLECCNDEQRTGILKAVSKIRGAEDSEPEEDDAAADAAEAAGEKKTDGDGDGDGDGDDAADEPAGSPEKPTAAEKKPTPKPAAKKTSSGSYDGEGDGVPELVSVALNTHGTRAVQKLVETLRTPEHIRLATDALKPGVVTRIKDLNGNHVIQRCLQRLEAEDNQFVYDAAKACSVEIATHRHGCCVLQRCVDHAADSQRRALVNEIAAQALVLSQDPFGNYVVQYILDLGLPWANAEVMVRLGGAYAELSMQKFSSNVVEKCLKLAGQELEEHRNVVVREIMSSPLLDRLLMDPYGNYVVQSTLTVTKGSLHAELVERIRPHLPLIKNSPFGKRILRLLLESKKN